MNFDEYSKHDALSLAELVKSKQVSPSELLECAIDRAEAVNPTINAIIHKMYGKARENAHLPLPESPFSGIPFLMKDLELSLKGEPMTCGSVAMRHYTPDADSFAVRRMKEAGLLIFGKTNTPEFGITPYTEPKLHGPTKNPWNLHHSPGGSSGGSAAAIAAGIVPMATAGDGGGSIRIPASACGLFGIKPSRGRISQGPDTGIAWSGLVSSFAISRSVRDSAAFLDFLSVAEPGEPFVIQKPERNYADEIKLPTGKLKIAFSIQHPFEENIDPECVTALRNAAELLQSLGHEVEEIPLPYGEDILTKTFFMLVGDIAADIEAMGKMRGKPFRKEEVEITTWLLNLLGKAYSAKDVVAAHNQWNTISRKFGQLHQTYDVWMCPTLAKAPIAIGELQSNPTEELALKLGVNFGIVGLLKNSPIIDTIAKRTFSYIPYTPIANMTGQPSMSVPLHWTERGNLPVGVMFTARNGDESLLFRLAAQLEQAQPWKDKRPVI